MKKISVLGATGSVGINTLKIIAYNKKKYNVIQLSEDGDPEYEYCLDKKSPFHTMPKIVYHKYIYNKIIRFGSRRYKN